MNLDEFNEHIGMLFEHGTPAKFTMFLGAEYNTRRDILRPEEPDLKTYWLDCLGRVEPYECGKLTLKRWLDKGMFI